MDIAGKKYWDNSWLMSQIPQAVNPQQTGLSHYVNRCFHEYFCQIFEGLETRDMKLLELGCARSAWLPYFAKEFGFEVSGIDYSEIGCQQTKQVLSLADVEGEVICADFFSPPEAMLETFDVLVSFGVVEHFEDTAKCLKAFSRFLKPGGIIVTIIPNMVGTIGLIQKIINRPIFDIHVLLDTSDLREAHELAALQVVDCGYFMSINFGICNLSGIPVGTLEWFSKKSILALLTRFSMAIWFFESQFGKLKENTMTSPYINCLSQKY